MSEADFQAALERINKKRPMITTIEDARPFAGAVSWGLPGLDRYFRGGGIPKGRFTSIVAEQNAGKSTLALTAAAQLHSDHEAGRVPRGRVLFIDTEKTFDWDYARNIGVDVDDHDRFRYMDPDDGMDIIETLVDLIPADGLDLIILDSLTFMIPRKVMESDPGKSLPAAQSQQNGEMVQRLTTPLSRSGTAFLTVNHLGSAFKTDFYGNPILEPRGGRMWANAQSVVLWLKRAKKPVDAKGNEVKDVNDSTASEIEVGIHKNKLGRQFVRVAGRHNFHGGFDPVFDLKEALISEGIVEKKGAWIYLQSGEKYQGEQNFFAALQEDAGMYQALREALAARVAS